jgi:hypothetical protein
MRNPGKKDRYIKWGEMSNRKDVNIYRTMSSDRKMKPEDEYLVFGI